MSAPRGPLIPRPAARPRLTARFDAPMEEVVTRFSGALGAPDSPIQGQATSGFVNLWLPPEGRAFFSPYLSLELTEQDGVTIATGRFGPHPAVWTGFMFVYAVLGLLGVLALMFGWAQYIADEPPWMLLGFPGAGGLVLFVYGAEYIGKGLGSEQMHQIARFVAALAPDTRFPVAPDGTGPNPAVGYSSGSNVTRT